MLQEIWKKIIQFDKIIIHRHISPDPDALGSQNGLARLIRENYPMKWVKTVGFSEASLAWMGEMDEVFDEEYEGALVIVTDTANAARIDDYRFKLGACIIKIDHHPIVDEYGDLNYTDVKAAATCEIIYRLFEANKEAHGLTLSSQVAELLYAGIIADSGRFLYDSTTKATLECVANLYEAEVNRNHVHSLLYRRSLNVVKAEGHVLSTFKITDQGVGYYKMTREQQLSFGLTTGTRAALVNTLANIEGIYVWVCLFENEDGQIRANIRSHGPVINEVAQQFHGGGHPKASGAMLATWEEGQHLMAALDEVCASYVAK